MNVMTAILFQAMAAARPAIFSPTTNAEKSMAPVTAGVESLLFPGAFFP